MTMTVASPMSAAEPKSWKRHISRRAKPASAMPIEQATEMTVIEKR